MRSLRIGLLLGLRQIQRASLWTTSLIIFVMMLTFLNLIAVSGILVGLIEGAEQAVRKSALGDVVITTLDNQDHILETNSFIREISTYSDISTYSVRYKSSGTLEANYKERRSLSGERDTAAVTVTGIDPVQEHDMTGLGDLLVEGEYLNPDEEGYILIGIYYIEEYAQQFGDVFDTVHFPDVARQYPFRGRGFYRIYGKVTEDFGVAAIEVLRMEKIPMLNRRAEQFMREDIRHVSQPAVQTA